MCAKEDVFGIRMPKYVLMRFACFFIRLRRA